MTATRSLSASLQSLNRTLRADELAHQSDAELVRQFVERRDEFAFAALVKRYGLLVFGVCRRVLRHEQDAEDAFQATFLVFARDAASVQRAGAVGNWLYGVAHNVARKARANRARRASKERDAAAQQRPAVPPDVVDDLKEVLDGELGALPDKYRTPIVLCDLVGRTIQEAAAEVGCLPKTLGTRLSRARTLLAKRLTRRGLTLSATALAVALGPNTAAAAVPSFLLDSTARTAVDFATGSAAVGPAVAALTNGVSNVLTYSSLKFVVLAGGLLVAGAATTAPVLNHLHARHAPGTSQRATPGSATQREAEPVRPADPFCALHQFLMSLLPWQHDAQPISATEDRKQEAPERKQEAPKSLAGTWVKKEGELKIEFTNKELKIYPHGENKVIVVICGYTLEKDALVKAKITGFDGNEDAKKTIAEKIPVGTEFTFKWKTNKDSATLEDAKCEKSDMVKSHLEGEYGEKK
jgi:RNA polymerase sigma factor (sigma-70 family)